VRRIYGASPLHLIAHALLFVVAGWALAQALGARGAASFALWFAGAIVLHDLIAFPLYSVFGLIAGRAARPGPSRSPAVNWIRVPALLSAFALVVWFPLIFGLSSDAYEAAAGRTTDPYLERWLLLTAGLFAASGLTYALRTRLRGNSERVRRR
jgi:hypothetical protein